MYLGIDEAGIYIRSGIIMSGSNQEQLDQFKVQKRIVNILTGDDGDQSLLFKPSEMQQNRQAKDSVNRAIMDNRMIDFAMKDKSIQLDVTEKAKLESLKGRNLSHILLNSHRYRKDSDEMKAVKDSIKNLEDELLKPLKFEQIGDLESDQLTEEEKAHMRHLATANAGQMFDIETCYRRAIVSCTKYLKKKHPKSDKGIERYRLVKEKRTSLLNEFNSIAMAKQLVWRGLIGKGPVSSKDLLVEQKEYIAKNKFVTDKMKDQYVNGDKRIRSLRTMFDKYPTKDDDDILQKEGKLLVDLFTRSSLPNALVEALGTSKEDRKNVIAQINSLWKALTLFEENKFQSITISVGENVFSVFQREDNSIDLIFSHAGLDGSFNMMDKSIIKSLGMSARKLATVLGKNMIENEEIFGKEQTTRILNYSRSIDKNADLVEKTNAADIGNSYLIKRLGFSNIDFTNIPPEEVLEKAKALEAGQITKEAVIQWVKDYEYGNKEEKKKARDAELKEKKDLKEDLSYGEKLTSGKTIDELIQEDELKEELDDLTKEENEKLMEKSGGQKVVTDAQERIDIENVKEDGTKRRRKVREKEVQTDEDKQFIELDKSWEERINAVTSRYTDEIKQIREKQKSIIDKKNEEITHLKAAKEKDVSEAGVRDKETLRSEKEFGELYDSFMEMLDSVDKLRNSENENDRLSEDEAEKLKERFTREYNEEKERILQKSIDEHIAELETEIKSETMKYNKMVSTLEAQKYLETDPMEKQKENELGLMEGWKDHNNSVQKPEEKLTFQQWKDKLALDHQKRLQEEEEKKSKAEKDKEQLDFYKELTLEIKELEERDLKKTTDEKINGLDTLDLLKHREKIVAEGKLSSMIVYTEDVEKKEAEDEEKKTNDAAKDFQAKIKIAEQQIALAEKAKKENAPNEALIKEKTDRIEIINDEQGQIAEKIGVLTVEYEQKAEEHRAFLASKDFEVIKENETAAYVASCNVLYDNLEKGLNEIERRAQSQGDDKLTEDSAQELKGALVREYQQKKNELEDNFAKKQKEWNEEPANLRLLREQMELLTKQVAELEMERGDLITEREKLEKPIKENSKQYKKLTDELANLRREAEANRRVIEKREALKLKERKEKEKAAEEKKKAIEEGREWSEDEENLKNFVADILYSTTTWDMDNEQKPGERIWNIIKKNSGLIAKLVANRENTKKMLTGFVAKLPLGLFGDSTEDLNKIIIDVVDKVCAIAEGPYNEKLAEVQARDKERQERKELNEARREIWRIRQEERRKEWEAKKEEKAKKREEADLKKFIEEHPEYKELTAEEQRKQYTTFKAGEKTVGAFKNFFGFLGLVKTEEKKEEKKDDEEPEEEFVEEEFVEEKFEDPYYFEDMAFNAIGKEASIAAGVSLLLRGDFEENEEINAKIGEFVKNEKEIETLVHKKLKSFEKTFSKYIKKEIGGGQKEKKTENVDYYREKGISTEEREARIKKGNDQMLIMMNNAMAGKEGQGQYLRNVLSSYLAESSVVDLRSMFSSAIRNAKPAKVTEDSSEDQKYEAMSSMLGGLLKGAGPLLQKVLQGMPEDMVPPGLKPAFSDMKDNLAPIPKEIVEAQLIAMIERSQGAIKSIEITKSLGAASVGQAFLCRVHMNDGISSDKNVVIKLLRPDVRNRMLREERIMRKAASSAGEGMLRTFEGQMERIREELDLTIEAKNCETGALYNMKGGVSSMKVSRLVEPTANALMVERAPGDTVVGVLKNAREEKEKYLKEYYTYDEEGNIVTENGYPKLTIPAGDAHIQTAKTMLSRRLSTLRNQQEMLTNMANKWVTEAVFGNGFYHGDLHAGNIMMDASSLTIIDFGNATQLTEHQQKMVTKMLLAAAAGSGSGFLEGFEGLLSEKSKELLNTKRDELKAVFTEVMHLGDAKSAALRIGAGLVRAQKLGFELPAAIYGFQQSQWRIQNTIDEFNKEIYDLQNALSQLKSADGATKFDVSKKYSEIARDDVKRQAMKFTLMPTESEEFRNLIKDKTVEGRKDFDEMLGKTLDGIDDFLGYDSSILQRIADDEQYDTMIGGCDLPLYFGDEALKADLKEFREEQDEEKRKAALEVFKNKYSKYNVRGALKDLRNAQDAGLPEAEIKALEDKVVSAMTNLKEAFFKTKKESDEKQKAELKANETDKNKFDEKKFDEENSFMDSIENLMTDVKKNMKDIKLKAQAEAEFKLYFEDEKYGEKLKTAFDKYYEALEKKAKNADALLEEVIQALRMPVLTGLNQAARLKQDERRVNMSEPEDFLGVMAEVIAVEWKKALKRIFVGDAVKYAWRINEDLTGQTLGFKDILSILMG